MLSPDVAFLCDDPDLGAAPFTVTRRKGEWRGGRFEATDTQTFQALGIIQSPTPEEQEFFPEGDKKRETKTIYTRTMLHLTEGEDISDDITWHGRPYRVIRVDRWDDWGFCIAYAARK